MILFLSCMGMQGESLEQLYRLSKTRNVRGRITCKRPVLTSYTSGCGSGGGRYKGASGGPAVSFGRLNRSSKDIYYRYLKDTQVQTLFGRV